MQKTDLCHAYASLHAATASTTLMGKTITATSSIMLYLASSVRKGSHRTLASVPAPKICIFRPKKAAGVQKKMHMHVASNTRQTFGIFLAQATKNKTSQTKTAVFENLHLQSKLTKLNKHPPNILETFGRLLCKTPKERTRDILAQVHQPVALEQVAPLEARYPVSRRF